MAMPLHLAMTAAEAAQVPPPENMAYMACHFASYGLGLSNIPHSLPAGAMLILNDRIPIWNHEPSLVARQLADTVAEFGCASVLLDLQRPGDGRAEETVKAVLKTLPCPVGVSEWYAGDFPCPVFLSSPPPDMPLRKHIAPWQGREVWLEAAPETVRIRIDKGGATAETRPIQPLPDGFRDEKCCCRYTVEVLSDCAVFTLSRTEEELFLLLEEAECLGVTRAVGLYQELKGKRVGA